jgi:hypothetical protein
MSRVSTHVLALLAVTLLVLALLSTGAGLGCSEGACGVVSTVMEALWLPLAGGFLVVVVLLVARLFEK